MARAKADKGEAGGLNQRQMVEAAMDTLGGDPGPKEIQEYVKQHFGREMKYANVASTKSLINKRRGLSGGGRGRGGAAPSGSVDLKDVATVKALVDRLGAAQLTDLIRLLGK